MNIEVLSGIAPRLYELVAPLVMSCSVLRQNNNYPFKTSKHYLWFVAMERDTVIGFIPVEIKGTCVVINNYYVKGEDNAVLASLIDAVWNISRIFRLSGPLPIPGIKSSLLQLIFS